MRLVLEHARAAAGGADDGQLGAGGPQLVDQPAHGGARLLEQAVALLGEAAAALLGNDHLVAQVLQHLDGLLRRVHLEVAARAAVEVHQRAARPRLRGRGALLQPLVQRLAPGRRHGGIAVDTHHLLHGDTRQLVVQHGVGDGRHRRHRLAHEHGLSDHLVAHRHALLGLHDGASQRVQLRDVDALRADHAARAAAGAVVDGVVHRLVVAEPLGLGAHELRPGEQRGHRRHGAGRLADGALDAHVQAHPLQLVVEPLAQLLGPLVALLAHRAPPVM